MLRRPPLSASWINRARNLGRNVVGTVVREGWDRVQTAGAIGPGSRRGRGFGAFGRGSVICFPYDALVNEAAMAIGEDTVIGKGAVLSAGWYQGQPDLPADVLRIGDRCLLGRGSSIVAHYSIIIDDDVWTGHHVHITDGNHDYTDLAQPIATQAQPPAPVHIGAGSWLGHGVVVLPGAQIGRHVVIGAGSVVTHSIPDHSVAVGIPARVIRHHEPGRGWVDDDRHPAATGNGVGNKNGAGVSGNDSGFTSVDR
jgi:carbonic anhydrase/acetyltransferase-like protein (isoleucine patch superfamily)